MKKFIVIGSVVLVMVLALGAAGLAYAQTPNPPAPFGQGMMGGRGGGPGMMGGRNGEGAGLLHDAMLNTMAEALKLTPEALQENLDAGETMYSIAETQGLSTDEFIALMSEARTTALKQAVEDGLITQEQADWMTSHMGGKGAYGNRSGMGECMNGGGGQGGRWGQQP